VDDAAAAKLFLTAKQHMRDACDIMDRLFKMDAADELGDLAAALDEMKWKFAALSELP
jgi:hypothetical protein